MTESDKSGPSAAPDKNKIIETFKPVYSGRVGPIALSDFLAKEYFGFFDSCAIRPEWLAEIDKECDRISNPIRRSRYITVSNKVGVPWWWIGVVHARECSLSFRTHLHNGDPLTGRTVHVPSGRPTYGTPPFQWEFSAEDALRYKGLDQWDDWSVAGSLFRWESYNGFGYRRRGVHSPYLWSGSLFYEKGKYAADGKFDAELVDRQIGAAVLLRRMVDRQLVLPD